MASLLSVDLGVRTGLALFADDGRLRWYRSQNYGSAARLRRGVGGVLNQPDDLAWVILEGGGPLADIWLHAAERRGLAVRQVAAETWRARLLLDREQRDGRQAKRVADTLARRVIAWSDARRPTSLRHDAAEAILVGLYGVVEVGWLAQIPAAVRGG